MSSYKVVVPTPGLLVTYPPSGHHEYTKSEAIELLLKLYTKNQWEPDSYEECWAEGPGERFTLHFPVKLV